MTEAAGVEDRIKAYVLAVGDGGLVSHFAGPDDADGPLQALPAEERERWLAAMRPIEPINFIGQGAPAGAPVPGRDQGRVHPSRGRAPLPPGRKPAQGDPLV
jgi:hypothetical protein